MPAREMAAYVGKTITMVGWLITGKVVETKHGDPMEFVSFEDLTGLYEATFFPEAYRRFCHLLSTDCGYILRGKVEEEFGAVTLTVEDLRMVRSVVPTTARASEPRHPGR